MIFKMSYPGYGLLFLITVYAYHYTLSSLSFFLIGPKPPLYASLYGLYGYAVLMRPNKAETAVHGCHRPGDMAVRMRKVLARLFVRCWPWPDRGLV